VDRGLSIPWLEDPDSIVEAAEVAHLEDVALVFQPFICLGERVRAGPGPGFVFRIFDAEDLEFGNSHPADALIHEPNGLRDKQIRCPLAVGKAPQMSRSLRLESEESMEHAG
jgi:hypothetical protein